MSEEAMTSEPVMRGDEETVGEALSRRNQGQRRRSWGVPRQGSRPAPRPAADEEFRRVWSVPIALAVVTVFGLLSALLGQHGVWWWLSWAALAAPLAVILLCLRRAARRKPRLESRP